MFSIIIVTSLFMSFESIAHNYGVESLSLDSQANLHIVAVLSTGGVDVPKWERGVEILPGGLLAVGEINNSTKLLQGYHLELVPLMIPMCDPIDGITSFVEAVSSPEYNIVGVTGLFCTRLADSISPLAGHEGIDLITLSGSTTYLPEDQGHTSNHHLYHMLPSSDVYGRALIALMEELGWSRIGVIYSQTYHDTYYIRTKEIFSTIFDSEIEQPLYFVDSNNASAVLRDLQTTGMKVVLLLVPPSRIGNILCDAYMEGLKWPVYAWILVDIEMNDIISSSTNCKAIMYQVLEMVFIVTYKGESDITAMGVNLYYPVSMPKGTTHFYGNVLHDSVWSLALSINASLKAIDSKNLSVAQFGIGKNEITQIIEHKLQFVGGTSFNQSSSGVVPIAISQIRNGEMFQVGLYYDSISTNETALHLNITGDIPSDKLERLYVLYPAFLHITLSILSILCIIVTIGVLVLYFYYRKDPIIKATSTFLSVCIFVGCFITLIAALFHTILSGFPISVENQSLASLVCIPRSFFSVIGFDLILATILAKTLRIYHIFSTFERTGTIWSDKGLGVFISVIVFIKVVIAIVWASVDVYHLKDHESLQRQASSVPYFRVTQDCYSNHTRLWLAVVYGYTGILLVGLLVLAFKTRKIHMENFKDTKKLNALTMILIFDIILCVSLLIIFRLDGNVIGSKLVVSIGYPVGAMSCICLLFIPKIIPPLQRSLKRSQLNMTRIY